jgi:hypothetical protein
MFETLIDNGQLAESEGVAGKDPEQQSVGEGKCPLTHLCPTHSWFGAAPAGVLSPLACSLPIYLAVYYLCRLQMLRSSSCPSPVTNRYIRLFPSTPALRNLGSEGDEG